MPFIDTHCHYNLDPLYENWPTHWQKAQAEGISQSLVVGANQLSCQRALEITQTEPHLWISLGFHPEVYDIRVTQKTSASELAEQLNQDLTWLKATAFQAGQKLVAIGETGLDYYYFNPAETDLNQLKIQAQTAAFIAQIHLANELQLPLIVHSRDRDEQAYRDILKLLKTHYKFNRPFVLHCASGPLDYISEAIELGAYIGFDGNLTYKKNQNLVEIFQATPPNRRLLETDAPFLPPQSFRGQTCEPWMVRLTAEFIQQQLQIDPEQLTQNALDCFNQ